MLGIKSIFIGHNNIECIEFYYKTKATPDFLISLYNKQIWKYKYKQFGSTPDPTIGDSVLTDEKLIIEIKNAIINYQKEKNSIINNYLEIL